VMGYLETGMRVLDAASALLSRLQELAVLGANQTNTIADHEAINSEAEAIADELNRLLTTAKYKGKSLWTSSANSEYVSLGGRDAEMRFGIANIATDDGAYGNLYDKSADRTIGNYGGSVTGPNEAQEVGLEVLPSEAIWDDAASSAALATTDLLTSKIEAFQKVVNTARVQAGSQYAALESAVAYTTDLTAQYELGYNTVNDVNFSMETAHLAKNQILQQAATAMLAQANSGQQGLLQLIQG